MTKPVRLITCLLLTFILIKYPSVSAVQTTTTPKPELFIISPQKGAKIFGNKLTVSFIIKNFTLKEYDPKNKNLPNEGYIIVALTSKDTLEKTTIITKRVDFSIENIPEGSHELNLELVHNDGTSLKPQIATTTDFTTIVNNRTTTEPTPTPTSASENLQLPKQTLVFSLLSITLALVLIATAVFILLKNKK